MKEFFSYSRECHVALGIANGCGTVVTAGTIITKDETFTIVGGVPAKSLRLL